LKYPILTKAVCDALEAIWHLERRLKAKARGATKKEIAERLGKRDRYVDQLIHKINQLSQAVSELTGMTIQYLVTTGNPEDDGPGRPHATYLLNHQNLVTEPKTATILLELLRSSK